MVHFQVKNWTWKLCGGGGGGDGGWGGEKKKLKIKKQKAFVYMCTHTAKLTQSHVW